MEITTMVLALALGNLCLCAALFFYKYEGSKSAALSTWAIARQCQAAGWLLLYLRGSGVVADLIAIPLGYPVLFAGVALEAGALWEAAGRPRWRRVLLPLLGVAALLFIGCYAIDEIGLRAVAGALILGGFYLAAAGALATGWRGAGMLQRFMAIAVALLALVVGARGILVLTTPGGWGWIGSALLQSISFGALYLLMALTGFGYLLLARERQQKELARLEVIDPVTDVANRRGFFGALAPWMALARRPGLATALVVFEFDQFKRVNDSYGHPAGDMVLRALLAVCRDQLRDSDQIGRLVGIEFALLLPRTGLAEAALVAERMRAAIAASPVKSERALINMTASFGVTTVRADDSTVSLFKRADAALQAAKLAGHNRVIEAGLPAALDA